MIRIASPRKIPAILVRRGANATASLKAAFDSGALTYVFDSKIYGAKSVKKALSGAQHRKCCYCETKFDHSSYGDVEHYRPKSSVRQTNSSSRSGGYYWLAYDLDNLFFSCEQCNRSFKSDLFPLEDETTRATSHHASLDAERPLLVNPRVDNPIDYIDFRDEYPFAINSSVRGSETIECTGLAREPLNEKRREKLALVHALWRLIEANTPYAEESKRKLKEFCAESGEYSSAVRALCASLSKSTGITIF